MTEHALSSIKQQDDGFKHELIELIHFIRTPLASIKIGIEILQDVFPELLATYHAQNDQSKPVISSQKIDKLSRIMDGILNESSRINEYIQNIDLK